MANQFRCAFFTEVYESTVDFYSRLPAFTIGESWDRADDDKGTVFCINSGMIEVLTMPRHDENWVWSRERPTGFSVIIELDDVDSFYKQIVEKNISIEVDIADMDWGHRSFQISDPNGVRLYFFSEIARIRKMNINDHDDYHLRLARPDEVGQLREIEEAAGERFDGLDIFDESPGSSFSLDEMFRLAKLNQVWLACDSSDRSVGMIVASIRGGNAYIEELDVLPEHGRRGLGKRLIEHVCDWALENGCAAVELSTFRYVPWNGPFYRKNGFRDLSHGEWTDDMPEIRAIETKQGLAPEARVFMRRDLR